MTEGHEDLLRFVTINGRPAPCAGGRAICPDEAGQCVTYGCLSRIKHVAGRKPNLSGGGRGSRGWDTVLRIQPAAAKRAL